MTWFPPPFHFHLWKTPALVFHHRLLLISATVLHSESKSLETSSKCSPHQSMQEFYWDGDGSRVQRKAPSRPQTTTCSLASGPRPPFENHRCQSSAVWSSAESGCFFTSAEGLSSLGSAGGNAIKWGSDIDPPPLPPQTHTQAYQVANLQ